MKSRYRFFGLCLVLVAACCVLGLTGSASASPEAALVLGGLDPVRLAAGEQVAGKEEIALDQGRFRYLFASEESRRAFEKDKERYAVQNDGHCATMPQAEGRPDLFAVHEGRIYLFGSPNCREEFLAAPATFVNTEERRRVAILLFDGVELLDFAGPGEVFAAAGHGRSFEVFTVAATKAPITSQGFVQVVPQYALADSPKADVLVIPGGGVRSVLGNEEVMDWLLDTAEQAEVVMSVCNGAFVLAEAGLLKGLEATTHHGALEGLRRMAPGTVVHADRRFVDNGKILTAAGVSSGIDAALHVVSRLAGPELAVATAQYLEYPWQVPTEPDGQPKMARAGEGK